LVIRRLALFRNRKLTPEVPELGREDPFPALLAGCARGLAVARFAGRLAAPGRFGRVLSAHCRRAFALAARADMGLAFGLLLIGLALCFFLLAALEAALTFLRAVKLGRARFVQRDGDGLLPVLHRAGL